MSIAPLIHHPAKNLKRITDVVYWVFIFLLTVLLFRKCSSEDDKLMGGSRMFIPSVADTTVKPKKDSLGTASVNQPTQVEINKFIDSVASKTTIKDFGLWIDENVSAKQSREGKWSDLYNIFLQQKYQVWLNSKNKKPKQ